MGLISQRPNTENPLPYFYDKESAEAIATFDGVSEKGLIAFDKFRNATAEKFPNHTKKNQKGELKIALDGYAGMKIRSFTLSATLIGAQLKERNSSDYEFVSATEPDENNISQLTLKILGNEKTLPLKKTKDGYKMFLSDEVLENINNAVKKAEKLEQVFLEANQLLENNKITEANFEEKMEAISIQYQTALM
ncbi:MAG: hypothetical protein R2753_10600 [Chitinophagales bacterium]